jgi:hypothetical protein
MLGDVEGGSVVNVLLWMLLVKIILGEWISSFRDFMLFVSISMQKMGQQFE